MFPTCFSTRSCKEQTEFSHKAWATSCFRSKPDKQHLSWPHPKPNRKVPQHWASVQNIVRVPPHVMCNGRGRGEQGQKYPQILKCSSSGVSPQTQNSSVCLWNCNSSRTRLKCLHTPNDLRAFVLFRKNKSMSLKTDPFSHWWWLGPIPQCLAVGLLGHSSAMPTFVPRRLGAKFLWSVSPQVQGLQFQGCQWLQKAQKIQWPWSCWYMPKQLMFCYRTVVPYQNGLVSYRSSSKATRSFRKLSPIDFSGNLGFKVPNTLLSMQLRYPSHLALLRKCYLTRNGLVCKKSWIVPKRSDVLRNVFCVAVWRCPKLGLI